MKYAKDLHRAEKGSQKIKIMEEKANAYMKQTHPGLASCYISSGYKGFDAYAIIAAVGEAVPYQGFVLYDEELEKAVFIKEEGDEE